MNHFRDQGIKIPQDLGIAGFDDILYASLSSPRADHCPSGYEAQGGVGSGYAGGYGGKPGTNGVGERDPASGKAGGTREYGRRIAERGGVSAKCRTQ